MIDHYYLHDTVSRPPFLSRISIATLPDDPEKIDRTYGAAMLLSSIAYRLDFPGTLIGDDSRNYFPYPLNPGIEGNKHILSDLVASVMGYSFYASSQADEDALFVRSEDKSKPLYTGARYMNSQRAEEISRLLPLVSDIQAKYVLLLQIGKILENKGYDANTTRYLLENCECAIIGLTEENGLSIKQGLELLQHATGNQVKSLIAALEQKIVGTEKKRKFKTRASTIRYELILGKYIGFDIGLPSLAKDILHTLQAECNDQTTVLRISDRELANYASQ